MNLGFWWKHLFRAPFSHTFACQVEVSERHRIHFFGEINVSSDPYFGSGSRKVFRHSILDLRQFSIEDVTRTSFDGSSNVDEETFVRESLRSYTGRHGEIQLVAARTSNLPRQFAYHIQSDTERLPPPLQTGVVIREVGPITLRIEVLVEGRTLARHRIQAYPDPASLTMRAIPNDDYLFVTGPSEFLWIDIHSGRVLLRGGI